MRWICIFLFLLVTSKVISKNTNNLPVRKIIDSMTDEEKIAQLITVRTYAPEPVENIFNVFVPGGFIYHRKYPSTKEGYLSRIKSIDFFTQSSLKKYSLLPLQMVDQEGCSVNRFPKKTYSKKPFHLAGAPKLGAVQDYFLVQKFGEDLGRYLFLFGYNMNLAPVVDIYNSSKKEEYIAQRSISSDSNVVQNVSRAFTLGLQKQKVIATFKHFPGYSGATKNSHNEIVRISIPRKEIIKKHLVLYSFQDELSSPQAIMSNIAIYDHLDRSSTATLSKKIIQNLLREKLKYDGIVISDDIGMKGYKEKSLVQRSIKAILAGHDVILLSAHFNNKKIIQIHKNLTHEFRKNKLFKQRVLESLERVLRIKKNLTYDSRSFKKRLQSVLKQEERLYSTNNKLTQKIMKDYFDKNPQLNGFFSKKIIVFSGQNDVYKLVRDSEAFDKIIKSSLSRKERSLFSLLKEPKTFGVCVDRGVAYCQNYATDSQKKKLVVVDSKCRPDSRFVKEKYKAVIPTYGQSMLALKMILEKLSHK